MKSLYFTACFVLALVRVAMATESNPLSVEVDTDKLKYRVCLRLEGDATEYDALDLAPVAHGLAPRGARVYVKDDSGQTVTCVGGDRGYSSAELHSGSPIFKSSFKKAPQSGAVYSDWFDMADLIRGLDQCSKVPPEKWARLMIKLTVRTRTKTDGSVQGQSAWLDLTPNARRQFVSGKIARLAKP